MTVLAWVFGVGLVDHHRLHAVFILQADVLNAGWTKIRK